MALSKFIEMAISDFVNIEIAISDGMAQLDTGNWSVSSVQSGVVNLGRLINYSDCKLESQQWRIIGADTVQ